jgi:hypothetical protein
MPEVGAGAKMPTSAELTAQKQQANSAGMTQAAKPASTTKVQSNKPRRGSQMMPETQGQMKNLSVKCASPSAHAAMDLSDEPKVASPEASGNEYGYGEGIPAPSNSQFRARRRGSVVKTLMDSEKNVDGDGQYRASSMVDVVATESFNSSVKMLDAADNQFLPQRRSSQDPEDSGFGVKRAMLKQSTGSVANSDDFGENVKKSNICHQF